MRGAQSFAAVENVHIAHVYEVCVTQSGVRLTRLQHGVNRTNTVAR
jgi:hypothetical protein